MADTRKLLEDLDAMIEDCNEEVTSLEQESRESGHPWRRKEAKKTAVIFRDRAASLTEIRASFMPKRRYIIFADDVDYDSGQTAAIGLIETNEVGLVTDLCKRLDESVRNEKRLIKILTEIGVDPATILRSYDRKRLSFTFEEVTVLKSL